MNTGHRLAGHRACWPVSLLLALAACTSSEAVDATDEGTSSTGGTSSSGGVSTGSSSGSESGVSEGSTSDTGSTSSSSGETGGETASVEPVCGNGVVEEGEACDEEDRIDEDGCNVDCTVSGSLLWSWDPEPEYILRVGFDANDALHALVSAGDGLAVLRFDSSGEISAEIEASRVARPPGAPKDGGLIEFADLQASDDGVYVGLYQYWQTDAEFFIGGHVERVGPDGWVRDVEGGTRAVGPRTEGGVIAVSANDVVYAFDPDGAETWAVDTGLNLRGDAVLTGGAVIVVASDRVVALDDATGDELWTFVEPEADFVFQHASVSAAEVWLRAGRVPNTGVDSLFRLGLDGSLLELIEDPQMGSWHEMTTSGNAVWMRRQSIGEPILIEKLGPDLGVLWAHEFGTDEGWVHLAVDGRGTVAATKVRELRVLAP